VTALVLKGLAFGFVLAATVGPMWVLCMRRTLAFGALTGFVSGMGIAVADGLYGAVAAFGLTAVSGLLLRHGFWIGLVGGIFLVYLGVTTLLAKSVGSGETARPASLAQAFLSTLALTLANPPTILAFAAIFADWPCRARRLHGGRAGDARGVPRFGFLVGGARRGGRRAARASRAPPAARHQPRLRPLDPRLRGLAVRAAFAVECRH
jgi:hypothetical protein